MTIAQKYQIYRNLKIRMCVYTATLSYHQESEFEIFQINYKET